MNSPKQLQRQAEEVAKYDEEMAVANALPPSEDTQVSPQADDVATEIQDEPPDPTTPTKRETELQQELAKAQQRYNSLMGKYNAEVPRMSTEIKDLRGRLEDMEKAPREPTPKPKTQIGDVTQADVDTFGADLIDLVSRQANKIVRETVGDYLGQIDALKADSKKLKDQLGSVEQTQQYTSQQSVLVKLTEMVPDWEQINQDQAFLYWLGESDPMSGTPRQAYLDDAMGKLDPVRLAHVFNTYKQVAGLAQPAPAKAKADVQRQVTPGKSKAAPSNPAASADTKVWTASEIESFYRDVQKGVYRGKEVEARRIEDQIDTAVAQGRYKG